MRYAKADEPPAPAVNAADKESFATVAEWVRKQMGAGGRYSYVTTDDRRKIESELNTMGALMDKNGSVDKMSAADKKQMFLTQSDLNATLARRDNDRVICKRENPIGSNIPVKTCKTAGEIEQQRRNDQEYLQRRQQNPSTRPTG